MKQNVTQRLLAFAVFGLLAFPLTPSAMARNYFQDTFGINNPSNEMELISAEDLAGLDLSWISDSVRRSQIEYEDGGEVKYDWSTLDAMLDTYAGDLSMHLWLVVNPLNVIKTKGTKRYRGKFLPVGTEALDLYGRYLEQLVNYTMTYQDGFKVSYWSIYNEPHRPYVKAFGQTPEDIVGAAKAYARLVKKTYKTIKRLDPGARIVLGGAASNLKQPDIHFYNEVLARLNQLDPERENNGFFDYFDYHDYNYFNKYKMNRTAYGYLWFKHDLLKPYGFGKKVIVVKEGATHTGKDLDGGAFVKKYQTERNQAEYSIKRAVFNHAQGIRNVQWSTLREHDLFRGSPHSLFCYNGLIFNGTPTGSEDWFDPLKHIADPKIIISQDPVDPALYAFTTAIFRENSGWDYMSSNHSWAEIASALSPEQKAELLANGTIQIGDGIKKLAYYTYKFMVDKLRDCDLRQIDTLRRNEDGDQIHLYEFLHADGNPIYVAWWEWLKEPGLPDKTTTFTLRLPTPNAAVRITKAIPSGESGADAGIFLGTYPDFFPETTGVTTGNDIEVILDTIPIYIELNN